jgi:hypothetical protein
MLVRAMAKRTPRAARRRRPRLQVCVSVQPTFEPSRSTGNISAPTPTQSRTSSPKR